ncbi:MAG: hypothetical protein IPL79_19850 [Myxococcales bacterium]|nr:hypothetical protein [Myxococcales bacterium]
MSKLHTVRLHLLCAAEDVETVRAALAKSLPDWLTFAPIPDEPGLYVDSGQWTPEQAARLTEACEGLPVKVWRGVALAYSEPGVVVVDKGGDASRQGDLRFTVAKAIEEEKKLTATIEGEIRGK